ncbi:TetR/AcrR family transcriptional regulator [Labrys wisconsinensis]|uniref:AcrR family transcriptional regulator n=1 Tax=Labrys wisconsinensis TaxID=425677 RepID=A0ABU0J7L3_9HYPH|nr:TetR/AcrR family transcriptional regulator [Labrys wisconsinensis]MDQ0470260.1 AcrR family transcriptional regulator [Labrys wisconsinensis]
MARTAGSHGARTAEAIRRAGLRLIFERGYEGMTLRDLAQAVGLQPGSLYNHIATKQALLFELVSEHMRTLTDALDAALAGVEGPLARLDAFVTFHVSYHLTRKVEVFVNNSELRSLEPDNREAIMALRRAYEQRLAAILAEGAQAGLLAVPDIPVTTYGILSLLTGVVTWYRPEGRLAEDEIVAIHRRLILDGLRGGGG